MKTAEIIIKLLVGLVVFVTGMNLMSAGLKASAGKVIRRLFRKIKDKRVAAASIGAGTTAIIQSSGATMVMVVGFLATGALTFSQGSSIILGAFLGTTVTGLFVSLSSFSFSIFLMATAFIGFILGFFKKATIKSVGEILIGFGILFFGLEAMKEAFSEPMVQNAIVNILGSVSFPLLLLVIGAVLTAITQSSSATNGIVIVMIAANPSFLISGFYLVLGATIGAMMPGILACLKANNLAKRVINSNLICRSLFALLITILVWVLNAPLMNFLSIFPQENVGIILAIFTIIYNVLYILVFLPLINVTDKLSQKVFKDKDKEKMQQSLHFINDNLLNTPSVAITQVKKEIENMYNLAKENFFLGMEFIYSQDFAKANEMEDREEKIDFINNFISDYLVKLSSKAELYDEGKIGGYYHVINDIERIGDHAINFLETARRMNNEDLTFSDQAKNELNGFVSLLREMFDLADEIFMFQDRKHLSQLHELEALTDERKTELFDAHFERIKNNECKHELSAFYSTLLSELERVADHLTNIGYSIVNPTGDDISHSEI